MARELAGLDRPRAERVDARPGRRLRPPGGGGRGAARDRRRRPPGHRALPGLDELHDGGGGRPGAACPHDRQQRRLAAPGHPGDLGAEGPGRGPPDGPAPDLHEPALGPRSAHDAGQGDRRHRQAHAPRVRQHGVPDGQLHLRHRLPLPLEPREPHRRGPRLDQRRVRRGAVPVLRPDDAQRRARPPRARRPGDRRARERRGPPAPDRRPFRVAGGQGEQVLPAGRPGAHVRLPRRPPPRLPHASTSCPATGISTSSSAGTRRGMSSP